MSSSAGIRKIDSGLWRHWIILLLGFLLSAVPIVAGEPPVTQPGDTPEAAIAVGKFPLTSMIPPMETHRILHAREGPKKGGDTTPDLSVNDLEPEVSIEQPDGTSPMTKHLENGLMALGATVNLATGVVAVPEGLAVVTSNHV